MSEHISPQLIIDGTLYTLLFFSVIITVAVIKTLKLLFGAYPA